MRYVVLLLPISTVISGPTCMDILPRDLDLFDDQSTAPADNWLAQSTDPLDDWLAQSTAPSNDWMAQPPESADDNWLLPPAEPFKDFDPDQDTVSTQLFDLPRSSTSPLTELDLNSPFFVSPEPSEPPADTKYSTISACQTPAEIAARKQAELEERRRRTSPRVSYEESLATRFFNVPARVCDVGTYPFCATPGFVTIDPLGVTLRSAVDCKFVFLLVLADELQRGNTNGMGSQIPPGVDLPTGANIRQFICVKSGTFPQRSPALGIPLSRHKDNLLLLHIFDFRHRLHSKCQ